MGQQTFAEAITDYVSARLPRYLADLNELCSIECPTDYKPGVDLAGRWVHEWAAAHEWDVRTWPHAEVGDSLLVTVPGGTARGPKVLLAAHLDTVYPVGTAAARTIQHTSDRVVGPGTCDNKSGLLSALYAMASLSSLGLLDGLQSVDLFCGSDEETDMRASLAAMQQLSPQYGAVLVLEAARENGDIVGSRKGNGHFLLEVQGKAAHAGVEPHRGANAILAIAQQIQALHLLNGMRRGATVNVGTVHGGTVANVVPDRAAVEIDVRVEQSADMEPVGQAVAKIAGNPYVPGTTGTLTGDWRAPPMDRTAGTAALVDLAQQCANDLGFDVQPAATGGVSYANYFSALGLPVLDGLGPIGGSDHSPEEYILESSIIPRTALLALIIHRCGGL